MPIIELENVECAYGEVKALDGITCDIEGGAVGILGPNGAGKSTLMKTLLGFIRATAGEVRLFGFSMPADAVKVRRQLGYMPEKEAVSPKVSAVSFLMYCGQLCGMSAVDAMERAHEVLNYVGLGEARYRKMETYSTGMLQRTKLAQALIHDPKLLLLDEPTNGLDPDSRIEVLNLIKEVAQDRGVTVLLSSHLLPDVQHVCERVIIINKGKIVQDGTIAELTERRQRQFEIRLRDQKDAFVIAAEARGYAWTEDKDGALLLTSPQSAAPGELFEVALACGNQIRHYEPARQTLAEVFMQAVEKE